MIENLQDWAGSFPDWLQGFAIFVVAAIPFIESYTGTFIGVAIGLHPAAAATAAVLGNATTVLIIISITARIRDRVRPGDPDSKPPSKGRQRLRRLFERVGIPGVALLGHPTQLSSAAMVGFGADRRRVIVWELVSITFWGAVIAVLAGLGFEVLLH